MLSGATPTALSQNAMLRSSPTFHTPNVLPGDIVRGAHAHVAAADDGGAGAVENLRDVDDVVAGLARLDRRRAASPSRCRRGLSLSSFSVSIPGPPSTRSTLSALARRSRSRPRHRDRRTGPDASTSSGRERDPARQPVRAWRRRAASAARASSTKAVERGACAGYWAAYGSPTGERPADPTRACP